MSASLRCRVRLAAHLVRCAAAAVVVGACAHVPPVDLLAADRAALSALEQTPLPVDFPAEARLVLSPGLLRREVQLTLDLAAQTVAAVTFELPFLGNARLTPTARVQQLTATAEPDCARCVALALELDGTLIPEMAGDGALRVDLPPVPWRARARAVFALDVVSLGDGSRQIRAVGLQGKADGRGGSGGSGSGAAHTGGVTQGEHSGGWQAEVELPGLPPDFARSASQVATRFLQQLIEGDMRPDLLLATLPPDGPVQLRGLRPRPLGGTLAVDMAFAALDPGTAPELPLPADTPDDGFVVQLPEKTLLALARAVVLKDKGPQDGWAGWPLALAIDAERFALDLRLWEVSARPRPREVRVLGRVQLDETGVQLVPESTEEIRAPEGFDPFDVVVKMAILMETSKALAVALPLAHHGDVSGRPVAMRLVGARDVGDQLFLLGDVREVVRERP
jgi:hypothetical protein